MAVITDMLTEEQKAIYLDYETRIGALEAKSGANAAEFQREFFACEEGFDYESNKREGDAIAGEKQALTEERIEWLRPIIHATYPVKSERWGIWIEPQYYAGTCGAPRSGWRTDEWGNEEEYPSKEAAESEIRRINSAPSLYDGIPAVRVLVNGQAGPDVLTARSLPR